VLLGIDIETESEVELKYSGWPGAIGFVAA